MMHRLTEVCWTKRLRFNGFVKTLAGSEVTPIESPPLDRAQEAVSTGTTPENKSVV